jgi:hypothetical protein
LREVAIVSGFGSDEASAVKAAYARRGVREQRSIEVLGWSIVVLDRD